MLNEAKHRAAIITETYSFNCVYIHLIVTKFCTRFDKLVLLRRVYDGVCSCNQRVRTANKHARRRKLQLQISDHDT